MKTSIAVTLACISVLAAQAQRLHEEHATRQHGERNISWTMVYNVSVQCLAMNSKGDIFAGTWGIVRSTDNGTTWDLSSLPNTGDPAVSIAVTSDDDLLATAYGRFGQLYRSTDDGTNWIQLHSDSTAIEFHRLAVSPTDGVYMGTLAGVLRSFDKGTNLASTALTFSVDRIAVSPGNVVIICGVGGIYRSTNEGDSWADASAGMTNTGVNAFAFNSQGHFFAGTAGPGGGVFVSTINGAVWSTTGFPIVNNSDEVVTAIGVTATDEIFVGTFGNGIFHSSNNGNTWTQVNSGLPTTYGLPLVTSFVVDVEGHLLAGTSRGIFRSVEPVTSVPAALGGMPSSLLLRQNYPNPFNPSTTIKYELPMSSVVRLSVYDMLGREVSVLVNEGRDAGVHEVKVDGSNLASGVYFYRLQAGDFTQTKRLLILK